MTRIAVCVAGCQQIIKMGLAFELAARAAEFYAEQHRRQKRAINALPGAIAKEWEKRKPDIFKEASGGKTELSLWIAHPRTTGSKNHHTLEEIVDALPPELAEMYKDEKLKIVPSVSCSRSWRFCLDIFDLTNELTKEYIARDVGLEAELVDINEAEEATDDTPPVKRVKRHCGADGDF